MTPVRQSRAGFTMIELLIVIGIISILVTLSLAIGFKVAGSGKAKATRDIIKAMDQSVGEFIAAAGEMPKSTVRDPRTTNNGSPIYMQPVADARAGEQPTDPIINSVGLYIAQCKGMSTVDAVFQTIDPKFIKLYDADGAGNANDYTNLPELLTVFDAFGRPLRYVHPAFDGLQHGASPSLAQDVDKIIGPADTGKTYGIKKIRRAASLADGIDADGGVCLGGRPYFYSAGPDGDPSTLDDNVYMTEPQFQKK